MKKIGKNTIKKIAALLTAAVIISFTAVFTGAVAVFADEPGDDGKNISSELKNSDADASDTGSGKDGSPAEADAADGSESKNNVDTDADGADSEEPKPVEISVGGGMFGFLAEWFGVALKWLSESTHSYIVGVLLLALIAKIVLFPLSIKQQKNSQKMARLAPKQEAIRKKYAGRTDRATQMKMNEEIQQLYADEKFNPMSGCLPMLLQLPIIYALYGAITSPLTSMFGYTKDMLAELSTKLLEHGITFSGKMITQSEAVARVAEAGFDPQITEFYNEFKFFTVNLMDNPNFTSLLVAIPILVFLSSFFSTKLIRKFTYNPNGAAQDASMKIMDWTMPLMILWFSFSVPALVGIYWIFQNIISIGQQFALYKLFPVKAPTPEEIREAELLMKGKKSRNVVYEDDGDDKPVKRPARPAVEKAALKKKKANSPFIYAKKGIDAKYLARVKEKGVVPKAKMKL